MKFSKKIWLQIAVWLALFILYFNMMYYFSSAFKSFIIALYNTLSQFIVYIIIVRYVFQKFYSDKRKFFILSFGFIILFSWIIVAGEVYGDKIFGDGSGKAPPLIFHFMRLFTQLSLAFFVATVVSLMEQTQKLTDNEKVLNEEKLKTELKLLKAQINPHFIFNALNNIYSLTYMKKDNAPDSVLKLSEMLRYVFYDCNKDKVKMIAEIKYIDNFIAFQQMKSDHAQNIQFTRNPRVEVVEVAPMLFIPFIENAFKYSKIEEIEQAYVSMVLNYMENKLSFTIENSIPLKGKTPSGSGLGIKNVRHRLDIIYKDNYMLHIDEKEDVFKVKLDISIT